jgi:hypothetical protein
VASKIARAVKARAGFITEYLGYGIACNKCKLDYQALALEDFIEICYPPLCASPRKDKIEVFNCALDVEDIPILSCKDVQIFTCGVSYTRKKMGALMNQEFLAILTQNLNQVRWFEFDSIIINGVSYLDSIRKFKVNQANLQLFGTQATNILEMFRSFNLPGFGFYISNPDSFEVSFPINTTWAIRTRYNVEGTNATFGILYTHDGAQDVQSVLAGPYTPLTSFIDPPVIPGAIIINKEYSFC